MTIYKYLICLSVLMLCARAMASEAGGGVRYLSLPPEATKKSAENELITLTIGALGGTLFNVPKTADTAELIRNNVGGAALTLLAYLFVKSLKSADEGALFGRKGVYLATSFGCTAVGIQTIKGMFEKK